ncbi:hypothetical protein [Mycobacterium sp. E2327]|uniref:hypothetical protein n=1 Tax=Mycobacterium sp. E2327 TaxID=1834132 RepID=UPI000A88CA15|nr:hypothetical protein [Mycobacterium sp. E2327]
MLSPQSNLEPLKRTFWSGHVDDVLRTVRIDLMGVGSLAAVQERPRTAPIAAAKVA